MARTHRDWYQAALTAALASDGLSLTVDTALSLADGDEIVLTLVDSISAPTKKEFILVTVSDGTTLTIDDDGRGYYETEAQAWESGAIVFNGIYAKELDDLLNTEPYNNGASGAFDYSHGNYQYTTLTEADTAISFSNLPVGGMMMVEIYAGDEFAPDISAITPLRNGIAISIDAVTRILAEKFADGTIRYTAGGSWAS